MPGARLKSFRQGDVAEALAGALLKRMAFVTSVPREEDVGHDFFCAISEKEGTLVKAGPTFTVQVKSNNSPIIYRKKHELEWILNQENPLFVVVSDTKNESLQLFSTWNMLNAFLLKPAKVIRLIPKEPSKKKPHLQWVGSPPRLDIYLGKPILEFLSKDLVDQEKVSTYASILKDWVLLDRENIVRKASKMYWIIGPSRYVTNATPQGQPIELKFYYNAKNLFDCQDNFVRSSIALVCVLRKFSKPPKGWELFDVDISGFLHHYRTILHPAQKQILRDFLGLEI